MPKRPRAYEIKIRGVASDLVRAEFDDVELARAATRKGNAAAHFASRMALWSGGSVTWRCPRGPAAGRARGRRHRGHERAGRGSRLAAGMPGPVPRGHGAGSRRSSRFGLRAGRRGCMLQHECPLARQTRCRGGWVGDRDDREDLPAVLLCLDAGAVAADLAAGTLACPSCPAGRLARWGYGRERPVRLRGGRTTRLRPRRARCRSCGRSHPAAVLVRAAPRVRHRGHRRRCGPGDGRGLATRPSPSRSAFRPPPCAAGCAAAWPRGAAPPARHRRAERAGLLPARAAVRACRVAAGRRAERRGRRGGLRPAQLRAQAGDDLAAGRAARPGAVPDARPRQLITCRRSRAPPCPHSGRRRSPGPLLPAPRYHD